MSSTTPPWPSLYNPGLEILNIEHRPPTQAGGAYLYHAKDVFSFTFYWMLIFYTPIFFLCGFYAFLNYTFPPHRFAFRRPSVHATHSSVYDHELSYGRLIDRGDNTPLQPLHSPNSPRAHGTLRRSAAPTYKKNGRRSRIAFALLVLLIFLALGVAGAVIGSAVLGFVVMGLYRAAGFNMSTWIPFLLAVIQVLVGLLSIWPSIIEII